MTDLEIRIPQSGNFINLSEILAPYLLKADVELARFVPSFIPLGAGQKAFMTKVFGPDSWELVANETIRLPRGKYLAFWCGVISKALNATAQLALASTSGGVNMTGFNMPSAVYSDYVAMPAGWIASSDSEEFWIQCTSSLAAPTLANSNLYLLRLGS